MFMKKPSALLAWKMLVLSLPKGIAAFVAIVAGLSAGLPLSIVLIGVPLLATTLVLCRTIMVAEARSATAWLQRKEYIDVAAPPDPNAGAQQGWRSWMASVLKDGRSYRSILFAIMQLPIGIAAFTFAIVLPVTAFAFLASPVAYEISMRLFDFDLFSSEWGLNWLLNWSLTSAHRSWIAGGVGLVFALLLPPLFRGLGYLYSAWILAISGPEPVPNPAPEAAYSSSNFTFAMDTREAGTFQTESGATPGH